MNKFALVILLLAIILISGASYYYLKMAKEGSVGDSGITDKALKEESNSAIVAAKKHLAGEIGISDKEISLLSIARVTWPDACLGVRTGGEVCAQMLVDGFRMVLYAPSGNEYVYHTNLSGSQVRQVY